MRTCVLPRRFSARAATVLSVAWRPFQSTPLSRGRFAATWRTSFIRQSEFSSSILPGLRLLPSTWMTWTAQYGSEAPIRVPIGSVRALTSLRMIRRTCMLAGSASASAQSADMSTPG